MTEQNSVLPAEQIVTDIVRAMQAFGEHLATVCAPAKEALFRIDMQSRYCPFIADIADTKENHHEPAVCTFHL